MAYKITITNTEEGIEPVVFDEVYQFSMCGSRLEKKLFHENFRRNMIAVPNELVGLLRMNELDIQDHKPVMIAEVKRRREASVTSQNHSGLRLTGE